jgi:ribonuclease HII
VDEAGRGCLFGPVVAAAVILNPEDRIRGLRDSKLLPEETRERLAREIRKRAIGWAFAAVDAVQIDAINILQASRLAMLHAVLQLRPEPDFLLVDAVHLDHACAQRAVIHGDALSASIAAASIIAKVERDHMMRELDSTYPQYALASNKGYGTPAHRAALIEHGPTPLHRLTFAPVRNTQEEFLFSDDIDEVLAEAAESGFSA